MFWREKRADNIKIMEGMNIEIEKMRTEMF